MGDGFNVRFHNMRIVIDKLKKKRELVGPDSPAIKRAMIRVAMLITNQAKINIRRHGLFDTGRLINSLRWEFTRRNDILTIQIASFGVPYAAFWEFGYHGIMHVRSHNRLITRAFGKPLNQAVISRVRAHTRRRNQIAKPYLRPAYERHKGRVNEILMGTI